MHHIATKGLVTALAAAGGSLLAGVGAAHADSGAQGGTSNSPGAVSGNSVQAPVNVPVNVCGNTINVIGILNPTFGNGCENARPKPSTPPRHTPPPSTPPTHNPPPSTPPSHTPPPSHHPQKPPAENPPPASTGVHPVAAPVPHERAQLAHTGAGINPLAVLPVAAGAVLGGAVLYRRFGSARG